MESIKDKILKVLREKPRKTWKPSEVAHKALLYKVQVRRELRAMALDSLYPVELLSKGRGGTRQCEPRYRYAEKEAKSG